MLLYEAMSTGSGTPRRVIKTNGDTWEARVVSHGTTSPYLHARVHRPIVEFRCTTQAAAPKYAALPEAFSALDDLPDAHLAALFGQAKHH